MAGVWQEVETAFADCLDKEKKIDSLKFAQACQVVAKIYDALFIGMVAGQLKGDILNSSGNVQKVFLKHPDKCAHLEDMIIFELKTHGRHVVRGDKTSGVVSMLWAKRAVQFIMTYLELLGTRDDLTAPKCAQLTYETVLMKYHGWFTSKAITAVMSLAPSREDIFSKLGLKVDPKTAIKEFVAILHPVIAELQRLLDEHDCDFPDKV
jgi:hypothetical protein